MRPWLLLTAALMANALEARAQASLTFDREKAVAFGSKPSDLPLVTQDDSVGAGMCETVELASPPLRVARVARRASTEGHAVDQAAIERAARPTLSVLYSRELFRSEGARFSSGGILKPPDSRAPTPCVEQRRPERVVLVAKSGEVLAPLAPIEVFQRRWPEKAGVSRATDGATAEFDLSRALSLGAKGLEVRVEYLAGEPSVFRFSARQLKDLSPSWAR